MGNFDHVRRKFADAKKGEAKPGKKVQNAKVSKADVALGKVRKLYAIEAEIEKLSSVEKLTIRQWVSNPLLNDLYEWLEKNVARLVPGSLIHKAVNYALNQWPRLATYCESGRKRQSQCPEPYAYLNLVSKELPFADTLDKLERLLLWAVKASQE